MAQRPTLPGRPTPAALADFWASPLFSGEASRHIESMVLLEPPVRILTEGPHGPRVQEQHMALITYGAERDGSCLPTPTTRHWCGEGDALMTAEAIVVDFPKAIVDAVRFKLTSIASPLLRGWSRTCQSPADSDGRRAIYGYTDLGGRGSGAMGFMLINQIKTALTGLGGVCVAHTSLLDDPGVLIADFTSPDAMLSESGLCDQLLLLSGKRGAVVTSAAHRSWERALTAQADAGDHRIRQLAWRSRTRGGQIWVAPQTLAAPQRAQLQNAWEECVGYRRTALHIQIKGDTTHDPQPWVQWLADRAVAALPSAARWTAGRLGQAPQPRQITPLAGEDEPWDGGLILLADSPEEAGLLASRLNGLCVGGASGPTRLGIRLLQETTEQSGDTSASTTRSSRRPGKEGRGARRAGRPLA